MVQTEKQKAFYRKKVESQYSPLEVQYWQEKLPWLSEEELYFFIGRTGKTGFIPWCLLHWQSEHVCQWKHRKEKHLIVKSLDEMLSRTPEIVLKRMKGETV